MKTMKALQVTRPRRFDLVHTPIPDLDTTRAEMLLVQSDWSCLCGSDMPFFIGNKRSRTYPLPPGAPIHECTGVVVQSRSSRFLPGDRVLAIPEEERGLAEFFFSRADKAVTLPANLDDRGSACLIQPLSTVMNAVDRLGSVEGRSVAIIGLGSIGLFFIWLLKQRGAARITGIDPDEFRCQVAQRLGAEKVYPARSVELVHASRNDSAQWEPTDVCIEAAGHQMDTLNDGIELVRKGGTLLGFGVPDHPVYAFHYETFFRKNINLLAVVTPNWSDYLPRARDLFLQHRATLEQWITHRLPIQDAAAAYSMYEEHADGILKALLHTTEWQG